MQYLSKLKYFYNAVQCTVQYNGFLLSLLIAIKKGNVDAKVLNCGCSCRCGNGCGCCECGYCGYCKCGYCGCCNTQ
jgi:hypothetical protein